MALFSSTQQKFKLCCLSVVLVLERCILNLQQMASAVNLGPVHWVQRTLNFNYQAVPSLTFPPQFLSSLRLILGSINFICRKLKCNFDLKCSMACCLLFLKWFCFCNQIKCRKMNLWAPFPYQKENISQIWFSYF